MLIRIFKSVAIILFLAGATAARSQSVSDVKAAIDASPFLSNSVSPRISDLKIRNGYLFASVFGLGETGVKALRQDLPLSMAAGSNPKLSDLLQVQNMLMSEFRFNGIYWTPIPRTPPIFASALKRVSQFKVEPGIGIGPIRIGTPIAMAARLIAASAPQSFRSGLKTSRLRLGDTDLYLYAENGDALTEVRITTGLAFSYGLHGVYQLHSQRKTLPRTTGGIGLGSTRAELVAAMGQPFRVGQLGRGSCGIRNASDEFLYFSGISFRLCDGIVIDVQVK